eukprot:CAMPEP_0185780850 /NCGR_PEP_ID=MMETSP1174-20130828/100376_1 /TAXON_ID=35687 /ORGANISM="Dictyocha speculum, Strain CCMP1381" /LENGTH=69 /DNA_ID=CAMNT_0028470569 /DNA_START=110 /DNA_END=316 /DNA_ORIENTATION=-
MCNPEGASSGDDWRTVQESRSDLNSSAHRSQDRVAVLANSRLAAATKQRGSERAYKLKCDNTAKVRLTA